MKNFLRFITTFFAAITLGALLAHLFALPAKINMPGKAYLTVQSIYSGWAWLGIFEIGTILLTLFWTIADRDRKSTFRYLAIALFCFIVAIVLFFIFNFPANNLTINWTSLPENWEELRKNWEYAHAVRAILYLAGFSMLIIALLPVKRRYY